MHRLTLWMHTIGDQVGARIRKFLKDLNLGLDIKIPDRLIRGGSLVGAGMTQHLLLIDEDFGHGCEVAFDRLRHGVGLRLCLGAYGGLSGAKASSRSPEGNADVASLGLPGAPGRRETRNSPTQPSRWSMSAVLPFASCRSARPAAAHWLGQCRSWCRPAGRPPSP